MSHLDLDESDLHGELQLLEKEAARRTQLTDPVSWATNRLGDTLWSGQRLILAALQKHRRVAVKSCHEIGKSYIASVAIGWWMDTSPPGDAFCVTSAPSAPQVAAILWRELGRVHTRGRLNGRMNQTEWYMRTGDKEELVAFGRKPNDYNPTSFQGIHAPRVLVVFDEANGVRGPLHDAADSLIANDQSKFLMIGNPDDPTGEFYDACKPGSGYHVISIGAFDSPNFTGEKLPQRILDQLIGRTYVEEKRRKWAPSWKWNASGTRCLPPEGKLSSEESNPLWQSKILGQFPEVSPEGGLIPIPWVRAAMERELQPSSPSELGVDVGAGGDSSTIAHRRGPVVRIKHEDRNPDTMQTCGKVISLLEKCEAEVVKIDEIGIGKGIKDRGVELKKPFIGVSVGEQAVDSEHFVNLRAELWWNVRERFESGQIDIDLLDEDLAAELVSIRYKRTSSGKIQIESKDEAKKRGVQSPNRADALMLALAPRPRVYNRATW